MRPRWLLTKEPESHCCIKTASSGVRYPLVMVFPAAELGRRQGLLRALKHLYAVDFIAGDDRPAQACAGALLLGTTRSEALRIAQRGLRSLAYLRQTPLRIAVAPRHVTLGSQPALAACLRGRTLTDAAIDQLERWTPANDDEILARTTQDLLWTRQSSNGLSLDLIALTLPEFADDEFLVEHFKEDDWVRLLPLLHFLRELSGWNPGPLRACMMFDDPNLHWKSFGYVRYPELVEQAVQHNFHVAFATVPIDGWYVRPSVAALFRRHQDRLSLLVHGNNHTRNELARAFSDSVGRSLVAQIARRIERLEQVTGLQISRVMVAPHSACSDEMADMLLRVGFEASCIDRYSLRNHNGQRPWPATFGLNMVEFLGAGLPVIPRFRFARPCMAEIVLGAFLGQPLVPFGHHEDLAGGLEILQERADLINSLGSVQWMNPKSIARTNFLTKRQGGVLRLKMYSREVRLTVPEGVEALQIERPWLVDGCSEPLTLRAGNQVESAFPNYTGESLVVSPRQPLEISSICPETIDPRTVRPGRTALWAIARRHLCEGRDRLRPIFDKFRAAKTASLDHVRSAGRVSSTTSK